MPAVLKPATHATHGVRSLAAPPPPPAPDPAAREIDRLSRALRTAQSDAAAAIIQSRADGRADAESGEADRLAALRDALSAQADALAKRLDELDGLAIALARTALARVFDRPEAMADMVAATLARHLAVLKDRTVLAVTVSGADFADPAPLDTLLRRQQVGIEIDPDLPAGACRVRYSLGGIDLDIPRQWSALAALLDEAAA